MTGATGRYKRMLRGTAVGLAATVVVSLGAVVMETTPAYAASTGPVAVGLGRDSDTRVLAVSGTTSGTAVVALPYVVGVAGEVVLKQRWTLEMTIFVEEQISVGYRFKNSQTGLCLTKSGSAVNNAAVTATTCGTAVAQLWTVPDVPPNVGVQVQSMVDYRCLDLAGGSTTANAPARVSTCNSAATAWYQRWKLRYGTFSCDRFSNQRILTGLCVDTGVAPMYGAFSTWRNNPVSYRTEAITHANDLDNFLELRSLTAGNADVEADGVEFGLHQEYARSVKVVSPYWVEWGQGIEEYHSVGGTEGGNADDGRNHSYMILPAAAARQWDILYDFNLVGTSRLQEGAQFGEAFSNLSVVHPNTVTTPEAFQHRVQLIDGNGKWRRPYLGETSRAEPKTCNALITDVDPLWDLFNTAPNCMTTSFATRAGTTPIEVESMSIGAPRVGGTLSAPRLPAPITRSGTVGGVDQNTLRACLEAAPEGCLAKVPHLQACVTARNTCSSPTTAASPKPTPMTTGEARKAVAGQLATSAAEAQVTTRTAASLSSGLRAKLSTVAASAPLHVVAGTGTVRGLSNANPDTYAGYTMVFDATRSTLLYACLGRHCPDGES